MASEITIVLARGVAKRVGKRFLGNAVEAALDARRQTAGGPARLEAHHRRLLRGGLLRERGESLVERAPFERGGAKIEDRATRFLEIGPRQPERLVDRGAEADGAAPDSASASAVSR